MTLVLEPIVVQVLKEDGPTRQYVFLNKSHGITHPAGATISEEFAKIIPQASSEIPTTVSDYSFLGTMSATLLWQAVNVMMLADGAISEDTVMSNTLMMEVTEHGSMRPVFWDAPTLVEGGVLSFDVFRSAELESLDGARIKPLSPKIEELRGLLRVVVRSEEISSSLFPTTVGMTLETVGAVRGGIVAKLL